MRLIRRKHRECWHHAPSTGESFIVGQLIDSGARKMWWCERCGLTWFM